MESGGFSKSSGPRGPGKPHTPFGAPSHNPNPGTSPLEKRSPAATQETPPPLQPQKATVSPPGWGNQPEQTPAYAYATPNQWLSQVASSTTVQDAEPRHATEPSNIHVPKRARSPPFPSSDDSFLKDPSSTGANAGRLETYLERHLENGNSEPLKRMKSPSLVSESSRPVQNHSLSYREAQRPSISPPSYGSWRESPTKVASTPPHQRSSVIQSHADTQDSGTISPSKPAHFTSKKAQSPPLLASDVSFGTSSIPLDSETEMQAKAKRSARFNIKVTQPVPDLHDLTRNNFTVNAHNEALVNKVNGTAYTAEAFNSSNGGILSNSDSLGSPAIVVGVCPDMCPESEREERERIGDLDKYERLDGDRNQTSKFLAVKKYNRTAERDADLIRPMPVLQTTIDYLLDLLNQPYSENFLGIYNFLWDRMRAIRMDLRMQHIFNEEAITMLEQMIRLHIIAMHELCEYKKGEGLSEGFDAHLNIEQMNKTSVELFQIYDDHRKNGRSVPTEKEFRGYYALLKLDRHPGYKVEPAELSLDLAKMTPETRCAPEILFARDVARACRLGNYISFFRLARKATYLQACLMHAHFAKLRAQALASLHSGLQNNQGIPVEHVVEWLAMEGEDIGSLLEYYGFSVKKYEETYMVKEGPFLNSDVDFPMKCSQLVQLKKSRSIVDDVYSGPTFTSVSEEREAVPDILDAPDDSAVISTTDACPGEINEKMVQSEVDTVAIKSQQLLDDPLPIILENKSEGYLQELSVARVTSPFLDDVALNVTQPSEEDKVTELNEDTSMDEIPFPKLNSTFQPGTPRKSNFKCIETLETQRQVGEFKAPEGCVQNEILMIAPYQKNEANIEKHRQIFRKWKQQALKLRQIREWKLSLANEALSSLSLGPPIGQSQAQLRHSADKLNIDFLTRERYIKQQKSWSRLNVSELVAPILSARNPGVKCICWKLVICINRTQMDRKEYHLATRWLLSKLMGSARESDHELLFSSSGISIWNKWIDTEIGPFPSCCLSIVREFDVNQTIPKEDSVAGLSCIMFLVSGSIPWEIQRVQLHNFLKSVPSGSSLPLLIVTSDTHEVENSNRSATITNALGLNVVDNSKIKSSSVVFLTGDSRQETSNVLFDDNQLSTGLMWLANYSPLQPGLRLVKTRELVSLYLSHSLDVLEDLGACDVDPHHCISAFNAALDRLADKILAAASMDPNQWPSPEIDLLAKSSFERMAVSMFLPAPGWSSATKIQPLLRAIKDCKLPSFSDDISWLNQGCLMGMQIHNQKLALQECLVGYLIQAGLSFNRDLASREATVMLQKGVGLELRDSRYHIVPRWVTIFRRIFNWKLMKLSSGDCSIAYVPDQNDGPCTAASFKVDAVQPSKTDTGTKDLENHFSQIDHPSVHPIVPQVSFDEMVEISCSVPSAKQQLLACSSICLPPPALCSGEVSENKFSASGDWQTNIRLETAIASDSTNVEDHRCNTEAGDVFLTGERDEGWARHLNKKDDRLSMLLEQCKRLQDTIEEKLAVYF